MTELSQRASAWMTARWYSVSIRAIRGRVSR